MREPYTVMAPDRFIRIRSVATPAVLYYGEQEVMRAGHVLCLSEGAREDVLYLPEADIPDGLLEPSSSTFFCRWKGTATYYNVWVGDRLIESAAWRYGSPPDDVAALKAYLAFDARYFKTRMLGEH